MKWLTAGLTGMSIVLDAKLILLVKHLSIFFFWLIPFSMALKEQSDTLQHCVVYMYLLTPRIYKSSFDWFITSVRLL